MLRLPWLLLLIAAAGAAQPRIRIETPMPPPAWALAERALLASYGDAARVFADKYLDERGFLRCVERWGGNDGPDDAMENFNTWTLAYALGAPPVILDLYRKAWEGHLVQYTRARAPAVEMARDGMYRKEFITAFDWEHTGEELAAFHFYALIDPDDPRYRQRVRRFAGFYMNEDPEAANYDGTLKIIRSLHNGSRGPKLTDATEQDWGGEPVAGHPERLSRYKTAGNIRGDHPLNLCTATLAFNAFALTLESKYRQWLLDYGGAWRDRTLANGGNIPTNIGLDGRIGGEWGGKWYGGVFGWNFSPESPVRNYYIRGPRIAFGEAFLLTADASYIEPLRRQIANLYAAARTENGRTLLPNKHGDNGWYAFQPIDHADVQRDLYLWSMDPADLRHIAQDPWMAFLAGANPSYPETALRQAMEVIRRRVAGIRADQSTPDTRAADDPQRFSPLPVGALVNLMLGGNDPGTSGNIVHARVRYFDPVARRAGLPDAVAALVEKIAADQVTLTLVNTDPVNARKLIVRMGAYGEHECTSVTSPKGKVDARGRDVTVELAPGAGERLTIAMKRYANQPTVALPW